MLLTPFKELELLVYLLFFKVNSFCESHCKTLKFKLFFFTYLDILIQVKYYNSNFPCFCLCVPCGSATYTHLGFPWGMTSLILRSSETIRFSAVLLLHSSHSLAQVQPQIRDRKSRKAKRHAQLLFQVLLTSDLLLLFVSLIISPCSIFLDVILYKMSLESRPYFPMGIMVHLAGMILTFHHPLDSQSLNCVAFI